MESEHPAYCSLNHRRQVKVCLLTHVRSQMLRHWGHEHQNCGLINHIFFYMWKAWFMSIGKQRQVDTWSNVLLGNLGSCHLCGCYIDLNVVADQFHFCRSIWSMDALPPSSQFTGLKESLSPFRWFCQWARLLGLSPARGGTVYTLLIYILHIHTQQCEDMKWGRESQNNPLAV